MVSSGDSIDYTGESEAHDPLSKSDHIFSADEAGFPPQPNKDHQVLSSELEFSPLQAQFYEIRRRLGWNEMSLQ